MSYRLIERSTYGLKPIECFLFQSPSNTWKYTSADEDIILDGNTYEAVSLKRTNMQITGNIEKIEMRISLPKDNPLALRRLLNSDDEVATLTIYRFHEGFDTDFSVYWKGRIVGANMNPPSSKIDIICESIFSSLKRQGVRLRSTKTCNAVIYNRRCNVNKALFKTSGTIDDINSAMSLQINAAAGQEDGYYTAGIVDLSATYPGVQRYIVSHVGDQIVISRPVGGLSVTDPVDIYPGCNQTIAACKDKFNNLVNYRGYPYIPDKNPFSGNIL